MLDYRGGFLFVGRDERLYHAVYAPLEYAAGWDVRLVYHEYHDTVYPVHTRKVKV